MTSQTRFPIALLLLGVLGMLVVQQVTWPQTPAEARPKARRGHLMAYDASRKQVVLFGGESASGRLSDTWVWDGTNWMQKRPVTSPPAMSFCAMVYDAARGQVVLLGDVDAGTWVWDGADWTLIRPAMRQAHAVAVYDTAHMQIVLFGGETGRGGLNDTWVWDRENWIRLFLAASPPPRKRSAMVYDSARSRSVLFGELAAGTWVWNGENWRQVSPVTSPPERRQHAMAYDEARSQAVLFGGTNRTGKYLNDT